ncbi:hypothetical protein ACRBEV_12420 [Methylobacterium phyllosphaerae]
MLLSSGSVLGIDVGCSPTSRTSAVCRLDWDESTVSWTIQRFRAVEPERAETIARVAGNASLSAAAFDGPLRRGLDIIGRYRAAERLLTRRFQPLIGKPGQSSAPVGRLLNAHANACAEAVLNVCHIGPTNHDVGIHDRAIVEAFPSAFLGLLIESPIALNARRGDRSDTFFCHLVETGGIERLIKHLLPGRALATPLSAVTNHDDRAALVCGLTALCVAVGLYTAVGDAEDGWIILPPLALHAAWARPVLDQNAGEERVGSIFNGEVALAA